jgi:hypothetical protein
MPRSLLSAPRCCSSELARSRASRNYLLVSWSIRALIDKRTRVEADTRGNVDQKKQKRSLVKAHIPDGFSLHHESGQQDSKRVQCPHRQRNYRAHHTQPVTPRVNMISHDRSPFQDRLAFSPQELIEAADALRVEVHNFAINIRALCGQFRQAFLQGLEAKVALVSRNDLALAVRAGRGRDRLMSGFLSPDWPGRWLRLLRTGPPFVRVCVLAAVAQRPSSPHAEGGMQRGCPRAA